MFCPKCKSEYRPGFTICSDCHVELVPELSQEVPTEPEDNFIEYEEVLSTFHPADIAFIKSMLDREDITYFFQGEQSTNEMPFLSARLMVEKGQVERVAELLKDASLSIIGINSTNKEGTGVKDEILVELRRTNKLLAVGVFSLVFLFLVSILQVWISYTTYKPSSSYKISDSRQSNIEFQHQAVDLLDKGKYDDVVKLAGDLISQKPRNANAYYYLAIANYFQGHYQDTIDNMKKAADLAPSWKPETTGRYIQKAQDALKTGGRPTIQ
ncbi:MAG: hypothetical protein ABSA46_15460 [Thermodesulfovibrionales bacterium]